jgi:inosine-uridine nucleoside N-ribohydrolase
MPTPLIIDTDTGVDDAMGVVYGLLTPALDVLALTTVFGNVDVEKTTRNTLAIAEQIGVPSVPVARGAHKGLLGVPRFNPGIHGDDGVGNANFPPPRAAALDEHAAQTIIRVARERPGEVVLAPIGPLTNLALAAMLDPELPRLVRGVVWMGGVVTTPGNVTPVAEADADHDPEAAQIVLEADWPVTMVGLDVTDDVCLEEADLERLRAADTPAARYVAAISPFYMRFYETVLGRFACAMHSALAVAIAADPTLATRTESYPMAVELDGRITRGMTVADRRPGRDTGAREGLSARDVTVVLEVDEERFKADFMATVCGG